MYTIILASLERFELPTHGVEDRCTIHCATATLFGATGRTRTGTNKSSDFKSDAATNYATVALSKTKLYHTFNVLYTVIWSAE